MHQKKKFQDALRAAKESVKGQDGVDKRFTLMKGANKGTSKDAHEAYDSPLQRPTDEQVSIINGFTRSPKSADELVVFDTWSMNDAIDRDYDFFTTQTVKDFAALEQPFSPVGKSFMVSHDTRTLPVGRIFATETAQADGMEWLKNSVYIPDIAANEAFLANQDFGIYWAVSVGVMLDSATCSICEEHVYSFGFCAGGHIKGLWYDPEEVAKDAWDWPEPVDEGTKGAEQCLGKFEGARDFYELSQVWLGAQYGAALEQKNPALAGVVKAAGPRPVGLSQKEASVLPLQHVPDKVAEALQRFKTTQNNDGTQQWVDELGIVRVYDPGTQEVLSLGKAATPEEEDNGEDDQAGDQPPAEQGGSLGEPLGDPEVLGPVDVRDEPEDVGSGGAAPAEPGDEDADAESAPGGLTPAEDEENDAVNEKAFLAAAKRAGLPQTLLDKAAAEKGADDTLASVVLLSLNKEVARLEPLAAQGEAYIKDLTASAIDAYVKAHTDGKGAVSTATFERILEKCVGNLDLIKAIRDEQMDLARAKFPTRARSSFPDDANERETPQVPPSPPGEGKDNKTVARIHG